LINNRQGGRRRGRGGHGGGRNIGGQPGNRQDNRQRGNAAQLLEKYKSMARDSQLAGDRVQTEYYLQFADHYFRVLSESRARFEDQNPRRQRDDEGDEDESGSSPNEPGFHRGDEHYAEAEAEEFSDERHDRDAERQDRSDRTERSERQGRGERHSGRKPPRRDREERESREQAAEPASMNGGETIPFDVLPPAIGRETGGSADEAPKPRRRARAARTAETDGEPTPAA
jgi:hypothetical protein